MPSGGKQADRRQRRDSVRRCRVKLGTRQRLISRQSAWSSSVREIAAMTRAQGEQKGHAEQSPTNLTCLRARQVSTTVEF